jgi:hypothetical protein
MPLVPGPTPADHVGAHAHTAATVSYTPTHTLQPGPYQHSNSDPYVHGHGHGHGLPARPGTLAAAVSMPGAHAPWPAPSVSSYGAATMAEDGQPYSHLRANTDPYAHVHDFPVRPAALVAAASTPGAHTYGHASRPACPASTHGPATVAAEDVQPCSHQRANTDPSAHTHTHGFPVRPATLFAAASMPGALAYAHAPGAPAAPARRAHTYAPQPTPSAFPHGSPAAATAAEQRHPSPPRTHARTSGAAGATTLVSSVPDAFKYSTCTGRRRALCVRCAPPPKAPGGAADAEMTQIGINYAGKPNALRGCVNDARNVRKFLSGASRLAACPRNLVLSAPAQSTRTSTLATSSC